MAATVTKAGPYYPSGSISFSSLRSNFKESASGSISVSELRRNTNTSETNPIVPNATENSSVSTSSNLALSQFRNTIKYYYITQTGTDTNFDIDAQTWNTNLNKNIRKWLYVQGTVGSNSVASSAADFNSTAYNLSIDISGSIYGAAGSGGTSATINGGSGGNALSITNTSGSNLVVNVQSSAKIYGGGGGGEKGARGANGSPGTCVNTTTESGCGGAPGCPGGYYETGTGGGGCCQSTCVCWFRCCERCVNWVQNRYCKQEYAVSGGQGGEGGNGGTGRGYNNFSGSLLGAGGLGGTGGGGCGATDGLTGETGGGGGDWASAGGNTSNSGNGGFGGKAIAGSNYSVNGIINSSTIKGLYLPQ